MKTKKKLQLFVSLIVCLLISSCEAESIFELEAHVSRQGKTGNEVEDSEKVGMKIEHIAFNVKDPVAVAAWYCEHLGMTVKRKFDEAPYTHFLADGTGQVMIEVYNNPPDQVPDYPQMDPLTLHLAFVSEDPDADAEKLVKAGCSIVKDETLSDGSHLIMLKDPWGFSIQLCKRANPMVG